MLASRYRFVFEAARPNGFEVQLAEVQLLDMTGQRIRNMYALNPNGAPRRNK